MSVDIVLFVGMVLSLPTFVILDSGTSVQLWPKLQGLEAFDHHRIAKCQTDRRVSGVSLL